MLGMFFTRISDLSSDMDFGADGSTKTKTTLAMVIGSPRSVHGRYVLPFSTTLGEIKTSFDGNAEHGRFGDFEERWSCQETPKASSSAKKMNQCSAQVNSQVFPPMLPEGREKESESASVASSPSLSPLPPPSTAHEDAERNGFNAGSTGPSARPPRSKKTTGSLSPKRLCKPHTSLSPVRLQSNKASHSPKRQETKSHRRPCTVGTYTPPICTPPLVRTASADKKYGYEDTTPDSESVCTEQGDQSCRRRTRRGSMDSLSSSIHQGHRYDKPHKTTKRSARRRASMGGPGRFIPPATPVSGEDRFGYGNSASDQAPARPPSKDEVNGPRRSNSDEIDRPSKKKVAFKGVPRRRASIAGTYTPSAPPPLRSSAASSSYSCGASCDNGDSTRPQSTTENMYGYEDGAPDSATKKYGYEDATPYSDRQHELLATKKVSRSTRSRRASVDMHRPSGGNNNPKPVRRSHGRRASIDGSGHYPKTSEGRFGGVKAGRSNDALPSMPRSFSIRKLNLSMDDSCHNYVDGDEPPHSESPSRGLPRSCKTGRSPAPKNVDKYGYGADAAASANTADKYGYEDAAPDTAKYGYEDATPDTAKYGYEDATPDTAKYGYEDATPDNAKYGYEDAPPDNAKYGYEDATPDNAKYGYEDATPDNAEDATPDNAKYGYEDATPDTAKYGYEDATPDTAKSYQATDADKYGYGDAVPNGDGHTSAGQDMSRYEHGDATSNESNPRHRRKKRNETAVSNMGADKYGYGDAAPDVASQGGNTATNYGSGKRTPSHESREVSTNDTVATSHYGYGMGVTHLADAPAPSTRKSSRRSSLCHIPNHTCPPSTIVGEFIPDPRSRRFSRYGRRASLTLIPVSTASVSSLSESQHRVEHLAENHHDEIYSEKLVEKSSSKLNPRSMYASSSISSVSLDDDWPDNDHEGNKSLDARTEVTQKSEGVSTVPTTWSANTGSTHKSNSFGKGRDPSPSVVSLYGSSENVHDEAPKLPQRRPRPTRRASCL